MKENGDSMSGEHDHNGNPDTVNAGGSGGRNDRAESQLTLTREARMLKRAIENEWPIAPEVRKAIMDQLGMIALEGDSVRSKTSAARALIAADAINERREAREMPQAGTTVNVAIGSLPYDQRIAQLDSLAEALGITDSGPVHASGETVSPVPVAPSANGKGHSNGKPA